jgi:hypothetical protein
VVKLFAKTVFLFCLLISAYLLTQETSVIQANPGDTDAYVYLPIIHKPNPDPDWLQYVNEFRVLADLPLLTEESAWSAGGVLHSRYMVENDLITHYEDSTNPWYTQEGYDAGRNGNVAVSSSVSSPDEFAINLWMTGPFHAVGIIDPQLERTGFGSYRRAVGTWKTGATLDVLRGLGSVPAGQTFPIFFPKDGGETWLTSYSGNESPDPLTSCPGYTPPSGPPILIQLGSGSVTPNITAHSFKRGSQSLEHCTFNETNYSNGNASTQNLGRAVLDSRDAVVIMPRSPLTVGQSYTASVTHNSTTYTWSFTVGSAPANVVLTTDTAVQYKIR